MTIILKTCTRCKETKPTTDFNNRGGRYPGPKPHCKDCDKKLFKEWYDKNAEQQRAKARQYHYDNRTEVLKKMRERYWDNPKKARSRVRNTRRKNPRKHRARAAVQRAIASGHIRPLDEVHCARCGNQANEYHHHNGYEKEHWLDVTPLCRWCHGKEHRID